MKLKCVGGDADGREIEMPAGATVANVDVGRKPMSALAFSLSAPSSEDVTITREVYSRRALKFANGATFVFLAPESWTDEYAIKWQFNK